MPLALMPLVLALAAAAPMPPAAPAPDPLRATDAQMQWWREARFGLFIHWGPVSIAGTEIGWSRGGERRGTGGTGEIPVEVYDNLYKKFNPVRFDAAEWVAIAKAAGMKYLVFTSRHHDGFSMFDTKLSDYKITASPFGRDVVKELGDACRAAGLKFGLYYSPPDWHHPDYRTERHGRFIEFLHGQLRELCTGYGTVDIIWFDGLGGSAADWGSARLIPMIRQLQPGVIINNRAGLPCDHDTPEQEIGRFQRGRAWESCITICRQWAWKPNDALKSLRECIHTLVRCAGGDGNLLLNVGPMPAGEIEPRQVARLKEIGAWLAAHGESIYGTRGGPFIPGPWGASTCKGNNVYVHVLDWSRAADGLVLPPLPGKIVRSAVLTGGAAQVAQSPDAITIAVAPKDRDPIDTLVVLTLDGPAEDIAPIAAASGSLAAGKKARASNVYMGNPAHGPDKAVDDDDGTRWATDAGVKEAWLEIDLGAPMTFDRAAISEEYDRVTAFELRAKQGDAWAAFFKGDRIGRRGAFSFPAVTAQVVRLQILSARDGPTIWEFQLFKAR